MLSDADWKQSRNIGKQCDHFSVLMWENLKIGNQKHHQQVQKNEPLKLLDSITCEPGKYMSREEVCGMTILCVWENGNITH